MTPQERIAQLTSDLLSDQVWAAKRSAGSPDAMRSFAEGYWKPAVDRHPEIAPLKVHFFLSISLEVGQPIGGRL